MNLKPLLQNFTRFLGYDIKKYDASALGYSLQDDAKTLISYICQHNAPVIFDVGANIGQSAKSFKEWFPQSIIHAFEPSPSTFEQLSHACVSMPNVHLNRLGVGSNKGSFTFFENELSDISSFLEPTELLWGRVKDRKPIEIITIDDYVGEHGVTNIDFLKIDTQGFDFEVVKGCAKLCARNAVQLIQMEVNFENFYKNLPQVDEIMRYLFDRNFKLVGFYGFHHKHIAASWSDMLLIHESQLAK